MRLPPRTELELFVRTEDAELGRILSRHAAHLERLAGARLRQVGGELLRPAGSAVLLLRRSQAEAYVPLAEVVDLEAERTRMRKEIERLEGLLRSVEAKLANEGFLSRAPAQVIEHERQKQHSLQEALTRLRLAYEQLS